MLERSHRLRGKALFQEVFTRGKRVFLDGMGCFFLPLKDDTLVVGVTFTQKAFPKAVTRHRYKRLVMQIMKPRLEQIHKGRALVIHFQKPLPKVSTALLEEAVDKLLDRITPHK